MKKRRNKRQNNIDLVKGLLLSSSVIILSERKQIIVKQI